MDGEDDPPFDDGGSPPDDGERWFDADEPVSDGDTEVHSRLENDDDDEDEGDPFAAAHSLSRESEGSPAEEEPEGSAGEDEPASPPGEDEPPPPEEPFVEDEEPGEIEPLTPENIERMLHERAPFF